MLDIVFVGLLFVNVVIIFVLNELIELIELIELLVLILFGDEGRFIKLLF